ncbi:uncharacterized protein LOC107303400 [Oryza brachyantha]|uniref:uncharacterized protein LOC107303400 n=1 Tax=Oryza brachyantha TaxID=4533 RepID=UPI000776883E|nr:uncharacterized protein LOC107303400 [Oryza brachyantha]
MIVPLAMAAAAAAGASLRKAAQEVLSPRVLHCSSLPLSSVTPPVADPFNQSPALVSTSPAEEAAAIPSSLLVLADLSGVFPSPRIFPFDSWSGTTWSMATEQEVFWAPAPLTTKS